MQTSVVLVYICEELNKVIRRFVWNDGEESRKLHLISWDTLCLPKNAGGLGIRKAK